MNKTRVNSTYIKESKYRAHWDTLVPTGPGSHKSPVFVERVAYCRLLTKAMGGPVGPYHPHAKEQSPTGASPPVHLRRLGNRDHHLITGSHGYACVGLRVPQVLDAAGVHRIM